MLHKLAHMFNLNTGKIYSWYDPITHKLMIGFQCDICHDIQGVHESSIKLQYKIKNKSES